MVTIDLDTGDISCFAGEAFTLNVYFYSDEAHTVPINMTGKTVLATVKKALDEDSSDAKAAIKYDIVLSAPSPTNCAAISFLGTGTNSTKIAPGQYWFDVKNSTDLNFPVSRRKFTVLAPVTGR